MSARIILYKKCGIEGSISIFHRIYFLDGESKGILNIINLILFFFCVRCMIDGRMIDLYEITRSLV